MHFYFLIHTICVLRIEHRANNANSYARDIELKQQWNVLGLMNMTCSFVCRAFCVLFRFGFISARSLWCERAFGAYNSDLHRIFSSRCTRIWLIAQTEAGEKDSVKGCRRLRFLCSEIPSRATQNDVCLSPADGAIYIISIFSRCTPQCAKPHRRMHNYINVYFETFGDNNR